MGGEESEYESEAEEITDTKNLTDKEKAVVE